jgi:hypothetical protein
MIVGYHQEAKQAFEERRRNCHFGAFLVPGPSVNDFVAKSVACEPGCYLVVLGVREEEVVHGDDILDGGAVRRGQAAHHARGLHSPQAH